MWEERITIFSFLLPYPTWWTFLHPSVITRQLLNFLFMLWLPQELIFVILFYGFSLTRVATYSEFSRCFKPGSILPPFFWLPLVTPRIKHDCSFNFNFYLLCHWTTLLVLSLSSVGNVGSWVIPRFVNCTCINKYNCTLLSYPYTRSLLAYFKGENALERKEANKKNQS